LCDVKKRIIKFNKVEVLSYVFSKKKKENSFD